MPTSPQHLLDSAATYTSLPHRRTATVLPSVPGGGGHHPPTLDKNNNCVSPAHAQGGGGSTSTLLLPNNHNRIQPDTTIVKHENDAKGDTEDDEEQPPSSSSDSNNRINSNSDNPGSRERNLHEQSQYPYFFFDNSYGPTTSNPRGPSRPSPKKESVKLEPKVTPYSECKSTPSPTSSESSTTSGTSPFSSSSTSPFQSAGVYGTHSRVQHSMHYSGSNELIHHMYDDTSSQEQLLLPQNDGQTPNNSSIRASGNSNGTPAGQYQNIASFLQSASTESDRTTSLYSDSTCGRLHQSSISLRVRDCGMVDWGGDGSNDGANQLPQGTVSASNNNSRSAGGSLAEYLGNSMIHGSDSSQLYNYKDNSLYETGSNVTSSVTSHSMSNMNIHGLQHVMHHSSDPHGSYHPAGASPYYAYVDSTSGVGISGDLLADGYHTSSNHCNVYNSDPTMFMMDANLHPSKKQRESDDLSHNKCSGSGSGRKRRNSPICQLSPEEGDVSSGVTLHHSAEADACLIGVKNARNVREPPGVPGSVGTSNNSSSASSQSAPSSNTCRGVYFDSIRSLWRANWPEESIIIDGMSSRIVDVRRCTRTKGFSAKKFGYEEAQKMAVKYREKMTSQGMVRHYLYMNESGAKTRRKTSGSTSPGGGSLPGGSPSGARNNTVGKRRHKGLRNSSTPGVDNIMMGVTSSPIDSMMNHHRGGPPNFGLPPTDCGVQHSRSVDFQNPSSHVNMSPKSGLPVHKVSAQNGGSGLYNDCMRREAPRPPGLADPQNDEVDYENMVHQSMSSQLDSMSLVPSTVVDSGNNSGQMSQQHVSSFKHVPTSSTYQHAGQLDPACPWTL